MGIYINSPSMSKEQWLHEHGLQVPGSDFARDASDWKEVLPVCLVHNGAFTAAAVADTKEEFERFVDPRDARPKRWFMVHIDQMTAEIIGETYFKHLHRHVAEA